MSKEVMAVNEAPANYSVSVAERHGVPPGYKQTDVGVIPEDWNTVQLGDVSDVVMGQSPLGASYNKSGFGVPLINGPTEFTEKYPIKIQWTTQPTKLCKSGDLLLCVRGSSTGRMNVANDEYCLGRGIAAIRAKTNSDTVYLTYQVELGIQRLLALSAGSTFPNVDGKSIRSIQLPLPDSDEQRAIAAALSDVDALIAAQDKLIAKKRAIKTAAMQQLLTGRQRLPGFSGEWKVKRLGELLEYEQPTKYLVKDSEYSDDNDVPVLTAGKTFILGYTNEKNGIFNNLPAIIFDDFTTANKYVTFPFKAKSSAMKILKPRDATVNLRHVFEMMQLIKFQLGDHKRYWISEYQKLEIKIPNAEEQTAIATVLSDMDADIVALGARRAKTQAIKQGMMQELLTGRVRLLQEARDETQETARRDKPEQSEKTGHNWAFNEAVVISVLAHRLGTREHPLGRMRCTKLAYLMHRYKEGRPEGYLKKAAGPYNPATRYKGPEAIARKNEYIEAIQSGKFSGFVAARNIDQALAYFDKWYGQEVLDWLDQFRYEKKENLELLATVDMAIQDLRANGGEATVASVKNVLRAHPEWQPKLEREIFSDASIKQAIARCLALFGAE